MPPEVSIAVLPFESLSEERDTAYFARGFAEDLIANLSRFTSLRVVASQSSFTRTTLDPSSAGRMREWGVDYVLLGSVRLRGGTLRISTQLVRVDGVETIWAQRFDAPLDDVFVIEDEITATVAGQLAAQVQDERLARAPPLHGGAGRLRPLAARHGLAPAGDARGRRGGAGLVPAGARAGSAPRARAKSPGARATRAAS